MVNSYKKSSRKPSNCVILHYHIISLEAIQQIQGKYYCTCEYIKVVAKQFIKGG